MGIWGEGLEMKEPNMKVMNVVCSEDGVVYSIVYIKIDGAYFSYRRYHAGDWYIDGCSTTARVRYKLEEAYQIYLKERILLKEEIMKKNSMPTTPGLYWAKSLEFGVFNLIVCVKGESPTLYVEWVFFRAIGKCYSTDGCCVNDISVWGPKIDDPDEKEE